MVRIRFDYRPRLATLAACLALLGACYGGSHTSPAAPPSPTKARPLGKRAAVPDDCAQQPGQPPPAPLRIQYTGVARAARCDREVYGIMGGITHFLGVECKHCHLEPDYAADTHNKQIANWMARELIPRLELREQGKEARPVEGVWCNDCHAGKAKFLGNPRRHGFAVEWMTTHLVEDFTTLAGKPPKCKDCHGGDLGSPEFRTKIILGELPGLPAPAAPAAPVPSAAPAHPPLPDYGER